MTDFTALLRAVIAHPDEDMPRLALADWFAENGQPERGEFVRVQVELAKIARRGALPEKGAETQVLVNRGTSGEPLLILEEDADRYDALEDRERELFGEDEARTLRWFGLPPAADSWARCVRLEPFDRDDADYAYAIIRRGFVEEIRCPADRWFAHADRLHWHPDCSRACAGTAQPLRKVITPLPRVVRWALMADPYATYHFEGCDNLAAVGEADFRKARRGDEDERLTLARVYWPGIEFELPTAARTFPAAVADQLRGLNLGIPVDLTGEPPRE